MRWEKEELLEHEIITTAFLSVGLVNEDPELRELQADLPRETYVEEEPPLRATEDKEAETRGEDGRFLCGL